MWHLIAKASHIINYNFSYFVKFYVINFRGVTCIVMWMLCQLYHFT